VIIYRKIVFDNERTVTKTVCRPFNIFVLIDFGYVIVLVGSESAIQFTKTVELSAILDCKNIVHQIQIPPGTVKIDSFPSVRLFGTIIRRTVNRIARNVLTTTK